MAQHITTEEQAREYVEKLKVRYSLYSLDPLKEAEDFITLRKFYKSDVLANELGVSRAYIYQRINVFENLIPELKRLLQQGELPFSKAYRLSRLPIEEQRESLMPAVAEPEATKTEV